MKLVNDFSTVQGINMKIYHCGVYWYWIIMRAQAWRKLWNYLKTKCVYLWTFCSKLWKNALRWSIFFSVSSTFVNLKTIATVCFNPNKSHDSQLKFFKFNCISQTCIQWCTRGVKTKWSSLQPLIEYFSLPRKISEENNDEKISSIAQVKYKKYLILKTYVFNCSSFLFVCFLNQFLMWFNT